MRRILPILMILTVFKTYYQYWRLAWKQMLKHTWPYEMDQKGLLKVLIRAWRICVYSLWCILRKIQNVLPEHFITSWFQSSMPGKWTIIRRKLSQSLFFNYINVFHIIKILIAKKHESRSTFLGGSVTDWTAWGK